VVERIDLGQRRTIHIVGVGGVGMAPIAGALAAMGHRVIGTDHLEVPILEQVRATGVQVIVGQSAATIDPGTDVVAYSTAVPLDNVELVEAARRSIPVVHRSELLAAMAATKPTIGVAGTHGKTTTSAMITHVLRTVGDTPSYVIGGELVDRGLGADWNTGGMFVVEADESDGSGFTIPCAAIVVTNIEPDHLEFHGSVENLHAAFARFMASTSGPCIVCADDPVAAGLGSDRRARTYGTDVGADYRIVDPRSSRGGSHFTLLVDGRDLGTVELPIPGIHNIRNATAALAILGELGYDLMAAIDAIASFAGVSRRFQFRGERRGITFVDDFAHLPTEIAAAVGAAHDGGWERVVAVFQPHRYSRTESLWREFADAFVGADELVLTDVYAAAEAPRPGVTGMLIVDAVRAAHPEQSVTYVAQRDALAAQLAPMLRAGDICLSIGAGDITRLAPEIITILDDDPGAR
jgi:UDP-N-acetylmuramate--alanine ligase